jgi:A/G-specific adenine glycosylase
MLQQTRVEAVKPYFDRFLKELPDNRALASCPDDRLMKLWEGLGYYNRARNLKKAALQIEDAYGGIMPADYEELLTLPGIGHYTAGAVSSIAYGRRVPAVDGNVLRVVTRLSADDTDIMKQNFRSSVEVALRDAMPGEACGAYNQALMELGACVCVPNGAPKCGDCPLSELCLAHAAGSEEAYPVKKKAPKRRIEEKTVLLIQDGDRVLLQKRPESGLLAGLYEFPALPGHLSEKEALSAAESMGFAPLLVEKLPESKHIFSHVEWHMTGYLIRVGEFSDTEIRTVGIFESAGPRRRSVSKICRLPEGTLGSILEPRSCRPRVHSSNKENLCLL